MNKIVKCFNNKLPHFLWYKITRMGYRINSYNVILAYFLRSGSKKENGSSLNHNRVARWLLFIKSLYKISLVGNSLFFRASQRIHNGGPSGQVPAKTEINWPSCAGARPVALRLRSAFPVRLSCFYGLWFLSRFVIWSLHFYFVTVYMVH